MSIKGSNVTLVCRATSTANVPLKFTWKHDNVDLQNFDTQVDLGSLERGITEAVSSLHLINVTHAEAGKYQCMVTNTYGTTYSSKAKISVLSKPMFVIIAFGTRIITIDSFRFSLSNVHENSSRR